MKNTVYIFFLLMFTNLVAQTSTNSTDILEETVIKKAIIKKDGKQIENKTKITTREVQDITLEAEDKYSVNQDRIETPIKVTKIVEIDNDNDPFYDSEAQFIYYKLNNEDYIFKQNKKGYTVFVNRNGNDEVIAEAVKSVKNDYYIYLTDLGNEGVGYFDEKGNFIIEYYDFNSKGLLTQKYLLVK